MMPWFLRFFIFYDGKGGFLEEVNELLFLFLVFRSWFGFGIFGWCLEWYCDIISAKYK